MAQVNHLQVVLDYIRTKTIIPQDVIDSCNALRQSKLCDIGYYAVLDALPYNYVIGAGESAEEAQRTVAADCRVSQAELLAENTETLNEWLGVTTWETK